MRGEHCADHAGTHRRYVGLSDIHPGCSHINLQGNSRSSP